MSGFQPYGLGHQTLVREIFQVPLSGAAISLPKGWRNGTTVGVKQTPAKISSLIFFLPPLGVTDSFLSYNL